MRRNVIPYADARVYLEDADILLVRGGHWYSPLIAVPGRSEYTHAAMAMRDRLDGYWYAMQSTAIGQKRMRLSSMVSRYDGLIDVFRLSPRWSVPLDRDKTILTMLDLIDQPYGWLNVSCAAFYHVPFWRFMLKPPTGDDETTDYPPFCSQAVAMAYRAGGVDLVKNLADRVTEPGDLGRCPILDELFTLKSEAERCPKT